MEKLTSADINELTYWFSTPPPAYLVGGLGAQTYDPKGSGVYDPTTDMRLENMVGAALSRSQDEWMRIKRVLDRVEEMQNGRAHVEILRRAFSPAHSVSLSVSDFRFPEVARVTKTALERAGQAAMDDEYYRLLSVAVEAARLDGCSPMSINVRVLEADRLLLAHGILVTKDMIERSVWVLLERAVATAKTLAASRALIADVRAEAVEYVEQAGDAYRAARRELGAGKRAAKAKAAKESAARLDEELTGKRAREKDRFEAKLARMRRSA